MSLECGKYVRLPRGNTQQHGTNVQTHRNCLISITWSRLDLLWVLFQLQGHTEGSYNSDWAKNKTKEMKYSMIKLQTKLDVSQGKAYMQSSWLGKEARRGPAHRNNQCCITCSVIMETTCTVVVLPIKRTQHWSITLRIHTLGASLWPWTALSLVQVQLKIFVALLSPSGHLSAVFI